MKPTMTFLFALAQTGFMGFGCSHFSENQTQLKTEKNLAVDKNDQYTPGLQTPYGADPRVQARESAAAAPRKGPWSKQGFKKLNVFCDGFPQVPVGTTANTCLGLVLDASNVDPTNNLGLKFPRKIVQVPNSPDFILTDMGGWAPANNGRVFRLVQENANSYSLKTLFTSVLLPYDVDVGPDGWIYVGEMGRIFKFDPRLSKPIAVTVLDGFPTNLNTANMHPLNSFSFGRGANAWDLFVNIGAPTDACGKSAPQLCPDVEKTDSQAAIRRYKYLGNGKWNPKFETHAKGLRNSMAQVIHSSGTFLQGENSRDLKSELEPHEELNVIEKGGHYGYPYCYNFNATSPEWASSSSVKCASTQFKKPHILFPPHVAPLDMLYYSGKMFAEFKDQLLVTWHGYLPAGSRIVSYPVDNLGRPLLNPSPVWSYNVWDSSQSFGKKAVIGNPAGGANRAATHQEIITDWFAKDGLRPNGSIVSITEASDGALWIVNDYNKTVMRLARGTNWTPGEDEQRGDQLETAQGLTPEEIERVKINLQNDPENLRRWGYVRDGIFAKNCISCHSGLVSEGHSTNDPWANLEYILSRPGWVSIGDSANSNLYVRMSNPAVGTPMPPSGMVPPADRLTIQRFIDRLKK